jgi:hypothetical protein
VTEQPTLFEQGSTAAEPARSPGDTPGMTVSEARVEFVAGVLAQFTWAGKATAQQRKRATDTAREALEKLARTR